MTNFEEHKNRSLRTDLLIFFGWILILLAISFYVLFFLTGCGMIKGYRSAQGDPVQIKIQALQNKIDLMLKDDTVSKEEVKKTYDELNDLKNTVSKKKEGMPFWDFIGWVVGIAFPTGSISYLLTRPLRKKLIPEKRS